MTKNGKKITQIPREEEQLEGCKALGELENVKIEGFEHEMDEMQAKGGEMEKLVKMEDDTESSKSTKSNLSPFLKLE